jgi:hypothetical protein
MDRSQLRKIKKYGSRKSVKLIQTKYIMIIMMAMLISVSIGYSYYGTELTVSGTVTAQKTTETVVKDEILSKVTEGSITSYVNGATIDKVTSSGSGGLCTVPNPNGDGSIYFFRGDVSNNYVSFAGLTWRILRINSDGSLRIILNKNATTSKYNENYAATSGDIDAAIKMMDYKSSTAYSTLQTWYSTNLSGYSEYIMQSQYVFDTTYQVFDDCDAKTGTCYYFGPYLRVGTDDTAEVANHTPTFSTGTGTIIEDYVGLITSDEVVYAGGAFNSSNSSYFLNIGESFWTMSPSFYDKNKIIGFMCVNSSGTLNDWPSKNTLADALGLRPVITIRGDISMSGDGTSSNPYTYAE